MMGPETVVVRLEEVDSASADSVAIAAAAAIDRGGGCGEKLARARVYCGGGREEPRALIPSLETWFGVSVGQSLSTSSFIYDQHNTSYIRIHTCT